MKKSKINILIFFLCLSLLLFLLLKKDGIIDRHKLKTQKENLSNEINALNTEIEELKKNIENIENDEYYIEEYVRDNLKMIKKGEIIVKIESNAENNSENH